MNKFTEYIFKSKRLGFRNWIENDVNEMSAINADPLVMEFFPSIRTKIQTEEFIGRMQKQFSEKRFCYFAVDILLTKEFIGFIGISEQNFESDFTPCIDIGWRIKNSVWNNGYATEGATKCIEYAFDKLNIEKIISIAPVINLKSEQVMRKIGMKKVREIIHPKLIENVKLRNCVLYEIINPKHNFSY